MSPKKKKSSRKNESQELSQQIIDHVSQKNYRPQREDKLARSIGVTKQDYPAFRAAVKALMKAGRVVLGSSNCLMLPEAAGLIVGTFRGNARGFGFVTPHADSGHSDLFIPPKATLDAISGDTVKARVTKRTDDTTANRTEGRIVEIVERGHSQFVGELKRQGDQWFLEPDGHALHSPVMIGDVSATRAKAGDQVVVEITTFPEGRQPGKGVIVEVLGRRADPETDTLSIIRQYHLHQDFPAQVLEEAREAVHQFSASAVPEDREDLRDLTIVTIDPDDARDFDDAISLETLPNGHVELGVHIADVSAFVKPDSALDTEARHRGNSIYFPRHVIPMLPEILSNGLCSLQEDEPRLTKSVFIEYDKNAKRVNKRYANSVIQSSRRLTYNQATQIIEGKTGGFDKPVVTLVKKMEALARRIQTRRLSDGMIVLDLPDVELVLDENDKLTDVRPEDTSFSHTIIEMFMIEANEAVAELFVNLNVPHLRRIHPEPPEESAGKLNSFLRALGKPIPKTMDRRDLLRLLDSVRDSAESFPVHLAVLRSMSQAEYAPQHEGHYALASKHYSHFTSPIRRYPDLVIHRLLDLYLQGELDRPADKKAAPSEDTLQEIGRHCSHTERKAEAAERELRMVKILRYLSEHVGILEQGVVTGVANVGIFVQLDRFRIDGLVRFSDLPDDWWDIDSQAGCIVGQMSGLRIGIGDRVVAQVAGVNLAARELDLTLNEILSTTRTSKPKKDASTRSRSKKRSSRKNSASRSRSKKGGPRRGSPKRRGRRRR